MTRQHVEDIHTVGAIAFWLSATIIVALSSCSRADPVPQQGSEPTNISYCDDCEAMARWDLGQTILTLGTGSHGTNDEFFRIAAAFRLLSGRVVVANESTRELRFFESDGHSAFAVGGVGGGPGEFRSMSWVGLIPPDTIVVYDMQSTRLTLIDSSGQVLKTQRVSVDGLSIPWVSGMSTSNTVFVTEGLVADASTAFGLQRPAVRLLAIDLNTGIVVPIGTFEGREVHVYEVPGGKAVQRPFFGSDTFFAVTPSGITVGDNVKYRINDYDKMGRLVRVVRREGGLRLVRSSDWRAAGQHLLELAKSDGDRQRINRRLRVMPQAEQMPAFDTILASPDGHLWVRNYAGPRDTISRWDVFGTDRQWLATVDVPTSLGITQVADNFIVAIERDSLGVELVKVIALRRRRT